MKRKTPSAFYSLMSRLKYLILALVASWLLVSTRLILSSRASDGSGTAGLRGANKNRVWIHSDSQPFNDKSLATKATHLIVVAGHSVLISGDVQSSGHDESVWFLLPYQRGRGLPEAIVGHISAGIRLAAEDEESLLVFSGGETRTKTPESEGGSYFRVADALGLWKVEGSGDAGTGTGEMGHDESRSGVRAAGNYGDKDGGEALPLSAHSREGPSSTVRARTTTEEFATDSYENLLFSVCRFREITGSYPERITFVSFSFKRERFETLHARAMHYSSDRFVYVGVDPPPETGFDLKESSEGERTNSLQPFLSDPYGCHSEALQKKRRERNPFSRKAPYELTCPEMGDLLRWCGPELISEDKVPW